MKETTRQAHDFIHFDVSSRLLTTLSKSRLVLSMCACVIFSYCALEKMYQINGAVDFHIN